MLHAAGMQIDFVLCAAKDKISHMAQLNKNDWIEYYVIRLFGYIGSI